MKKMLVLMLAFIPMLSMAQVKKENYVITGNVKELTKDKLSVTIWNGGGEAINSEVEVIDGKFTYKGFAEGPMMVRFFVMQDRVLKRRKGSQGYVPVKCSNMWCIVFPGANVKMNGKLSDFAEVFPKGDKENEILAKFMKEYFPLINESANIGIYISENKDFPKENIDELRAEAKVLNDKATAVLNSFVRKEASSYAALWYMDDMMGRKQLTVEDVKEILATVKPEYKNNNLYKKVELRVNSLNYEVGKKINNLVSENTYDGSKIDIMNYRGKYVLIDFWGSWCGPCMAGMPEIKKLSEKYKDNLVVLGIAQDRESSWKQAIESSKLNWLHILNGKGDVDFISMFNITGFPTKILVSPTGEILYRVGGEDISSYIKMEEFINKK